MGEGQGVAGVKLCRDCAHKDERVPGVLVGDPVRPCSRAPAAATAFDARHDVCKGRLWERASPAI